MVHLHQRTIEQLTHTPGPWRIHGTSRLARIHAGRGAPSYDTEVAVVFETTANSAANARLIASAPDLLAALRELAAAWEATHFELPTRLATALAEAQRVIEDAEGR